jgi:methylated-DNA-[protein]-cysteine S-methyltransferase
MNTDVTTVSHTVIASPLGDLTLTARDGMLSGLVIAGQRGGPDAAELGERRDHDFDEVRRQLEEYFAGTRRSFDLRLALRGDTFRRRVWTLLGQIPFGETRSYGQLASALGDRNLAQAVGAANGRNPIAIIIPCHRVVGADGALVGYAGGLERKRWLLEHEAKVTGTWSALF